MSTATTLRRLLKDYTLLWAMLLGLLLHEWAYPLAPILPYTLFAMLLFAYTKIKPSDLKPRRTHFWLFVAQWGLGILAYLLLEPYNSLIAQGVALIILTPTATAASVITHMLGGSVAFVTTNLIISNVAIAFIGSLLISIIHPTTDISYIELVAQLLGKVSFLLLLPLLIIWLLRYKAPKWHGTLEHYSKATFYIWAMNVLVVTAHAVHTFKADPDFTLRYAALLGAVTFVTTAVMYLLGGKISKLRGEPIVDGRQAFGQKNTVFAIWLAMSFLGAEVAIIPTFYIIWQNIFNSIELALHRSR